jgi:hypothetical protein
MKKDPRRARQQSKQDELGKSDELTDAELGQASGGTRTTRLSSDGLSPATSSNTK